MKKCSSLVWRFFDRIENESKRCLAVLCKLCETQYKFFGNTTNLRSHMVNKHPLQWELAQNQTLDEANFRIDDEDTNQSTTSPKRRKYSRAYNKDKNVRYSVSVDNPRISTGGQAIPKIEIQRIDVLEASDGENDNEETEATLNLVRQLHNSSGLRGSDEEWLEDETYAPIYEPKRKKMAYRKIKREVLTPPRRQSYVRVIKNEPKPTPSPIVLDSYKDEYSVFGEYVANKLRKFKTPRTRGNLQQLITTILWQAEYGAYDNADAVKRLLMYSVHAQEPEPESQIHQEFETHVQTEEVIDQREDEPNQSIE
ncbi:uncharacterized protein LOC128678316 isoform X1 [Plodia interpunctella]|uniref:uncharacterized protein LOC128678316 isoform X1 n=1 Tax=Plodia interpunctella TaxID=58824 RepID=UPI00236846B3|nr:uncharacterized protein LOC128678316 isoform X1 [Plodia interpunctella]